MFINLLFACVVCVCVCAHVCVCVCVCVCMCGEKMRTRLWVFHLNKPEG